MIEFVVDKTYENKTVADFFADQGFSTTQIKRFKFQGEISVNGRPVTVRQVLHIGDRVKIADETHLKTPEFSEIPAEIVFADRHLYLANKPYGIAIHPDRAHKADTLGNSLAKHFGQGFELRIVTRLDKTTSGLVLGALDSITAQRLNDMLKNGQIAKSYLAKVEGIVTVAGEISLPLLRDDSQNKTVVDEKGKPALTQFEVLGHKGNTTTLLVFPKTGRTHQIRAHLASVGHPIVGDVLYGAQPALRICLHCCGLKFVHPQTGETVNISCPVEF